jgi:TRAP-type C4-dicarboxylate transport system permease small subunit
MAQVKSAPVIALLDRSLQVFTGFLVAVLLGVVTAGIVFRAFNEPLSWTDEVCGFLMVWLACLGWMIATRHGSHIRIRLLLDKLPGAAWRGTEVIIQVAVALIGIVVAWKSIHLMQVNSDIEAMSLPISVAWMYAPLLPAGLVTVGQALADMVKSRLAGREVDEVSPW